mmetsp:Transcript_7596/g.32278  ORF Transcript_7596/g.32278 Transcript_7596/m.32278 type:complete len:229 (-) Transcript_7596:18-704(-)
MVPGSSPAVGDETQQTGVAAHVRRARVLRIRRGVVSAARGRVRHGVRGLHFEDLGRAAPALDAHDSRARVRDFNLRLEQVQRLRHRHRRRGQDGEDVGRAQPQPAARDGARAPVRGAPREVLAARGEHRVHGVVRHDHRDVRLEGGGVRRGDGPGGAPMGTPHRVRRRAGLLVPARGAAGELRVGRDGVRVAGERGAHGGRADGHGPRPRGRAAASALTRLSRLVADE